MSAVYTQILLQVVRDRNASRMMIRVTALLLVGALVTVLLVSSLHLHTELMWQAPLGMLAMLIVMWCGTVLQAAVRQNHPAYAGLVPQLRRRLIVLTLGLFAACGLTLAAIAAAIFGHFGYALLSAATFLCYMLYAQRYTLMGFLPSAIILGSLSLKELLLPAWRSLALLGEPALTGIGLIVVAALGAVGVQLAFPRGGDRHWAWHARHAALVHKIQGSVTKPEDGGAVSCWSRWFHVGYGAALRRDSRGGAPAGRILMHSMGPVVHEGGYHAYLLLVTAVVAGVVLNSGPDAAEVREMMRTFIMQICVLAVVVTYAFELLKGASRHATEQALFLLTPAAPAAVRINRLLASTLLLRFARVWLLATVCAFGLDMVSIGAPRIYGSTFLLAALLLPLSCVLLRNYALTPASHRQTTSLAWTVVAIVAYLVGLAAERNLSEFPLFWAGGAVMLATLLVLRWRWLRMMALPAVLPAGRLLA